MPPNPASPQPETPDSLSLNKENILRGKVSLLKTKGTITEPRLRNPLQSKDANKITPALTHQPHIKSVSAPDLGKKRIPLTIVERNEVAEETKINVKRSKTESTNRQQETRKDSSDFNEWTLLGDGLGNVRRILKKLQPGTTFEDVNTPLELFKKLEVNGDLKPAVLKLFSSFPGIVSVMMGPTYGGKVNEIGLIEIGPNPSFNCTVPFYHGFADLCALDLTCVPIEDEEVRYLIKLEKLQALGLSGTRISNRAIRYLGKHAKFAKTLQCLKLCYLEKVDDDGVADLTSFSSLREIDLYGTTKVTLSAVTKILPSDPKDSSLCKLRLSEKATSLLNSRHVSYAELSRKTDLISNPEGIFGMSVAQIQMNLRIHRHLFPDIYLNLDPQTLEQKLHSILIRRRQEEFLWRICQ